MIANFLLSSSKSRNSIINRGSIIRLSQFVTFSLPFLRLLISTAVPSLRLVLFSIPQTRNARSLSASIAALAQAETVRPISSGLQLLCLNSNHAHSRGSRNNRRNRAFGSLVAIPCTPLVRYSFYPPYIRSTRSDESVGSFLSLKTGT